MSTGMDNSLNQQALMDKFQYGSESPVGGGAMEETSSVVAPDNLGMAVKDLESQRRQEQVIAAKYSDLAKQYQKALEEIGRLKGLNTSLEKKTSKTEIQESSRDTVNPEARSETEIQASS